MKNKAEAAESVRDRQARLEASMRAAVTEWDIEAEIRCALRPDGKMDFTVISRRFEGSDDREREAGFWPALDPLPKSDMVYLTFCLLLTPEEAESSFGDAAAMPTAVEDWDE